MAAGSFNVAKIAAQTRNYVLAAMWKLANSRAPGEMLRRCVFFFLWEHLRS